MNETKTLNKLYRTKPSIRLWTKVWRCVEVQRRRDLALMAILSTVPMYSGASRGVFASPGGTYITSNSLNIQLKSATIAIQLRLLEPGIDNQQMPLFPF